MKPRKKRETVMILAIFISYTSLAEKNKDKKKKNLSTEKQSNKRAKIRMNSTKRGVVKGDSTFSYYILYISFYLLVTVLDCLILDVKQK